MIHSRRLVVDKVSIPQPEHVTGQATSTLRSHHFKQIQDNSNHQPLTEVSRNTKITMDSDGAKDQTITVVGAAETLTAKAKLAEKGTGKVLAVGSYATRCRALFSEVFAFSGCLSFVE